MHGLNGFSYNNIAKGIFKNTSDYSEIQVFFEQLPLFASNRYQKQSIQGRDGQITIVDGKDNKEMVCIVRIISNDTGRKMRLIRELAQWLSGSGQLVLNFDQSIVYEAQLLNTIPVDKAFALYEFTLVFDLKPLGESNWDPFNFKTDDPVPTDIEWPVDGYQNSFDVTGTTNITLKNNGTYKSYPLIVLNGSADSVSITYDSKTLTYENLSNEEVTIDTKNWKVFQDSANKRSGLTSGFNDNYIPYGDTACTITGSNMDLTVTFDYLFAYE